MTMGEEEWLHKEQLVKSQILEVFPEVKWNLEACISRLYALADNVDKVHRDCTISNVVSDTAGTVSGVLSILGICLAPVTAGLSLGLGAVGLGLGAAAAVTSICTSIVEASHIASAQAEANKLLSTSSKRSENTVKPWIEKTRNMASTAQEVIKNVTDIAVKIRDFRLVRKYPRLDRPLRTAIHVAEQDIQPVQNFLGRTTLAMTKGARLVSTAFHGIFLVIDAISLSKDVKHLQEGAKEQSAEELRESAEDLKKQLEELTRIYETLRQEQDSETPEYF
ncbi:apolipoprotein L3-like [Tenrec ecaudatus]|uniref:apolipoprotein L3-like n=1 Tax=Tenrec ecaudatus TaxID=94439 RepID=UPI003F5A43D2